MEIAHGIFARYIGNMKSLNFVLDTDGVLTDGKFYYTAEGKVMKAFGVHDHEGLNMLRDRFNISFITGDKQGFDISNQRIRHMGFSLTVVSESERHGYLNNLGFNRTVFMGDGYSDAPCLRDCILGIAPSNARREARDAADFVTPSRGGEGAVMDACLHILDRIKYGTL